MVDGPLALELQQASARLQGPSVLQMHLNLGDRVCGESFPVGPEGDRGLFRGQVHVARPAPPVGVVGAIGPWERTPVPDQYGRTSFLLPRSPGPATVVVKPGRPENPLWMHCWLARYAGRDRPPRRGPVGFRSFSPRAHTGRSAGPPILRWTTIRVHRPPRGPSRHNRLRALCGEPLKR